MAAFYLEFYPMKTTLFYFLEEACQRYNTVDFIANDPISTPHLFSKKEDIEIAGFVSALLAWGQRKTTIKKSRELMAMMDNEPFNFLSAAKESDFKHFLSFKHRTFDGSDCVTLLQALQHLYATHGGIEAVVSKGFSRGGAFQAIEMLAQSLLEVPHMQRFRKHISRPSAGSAAKRINMYFRWMIRQDDSGVDFGLWKNVSPSLLVCPLDVHSGNVARKIGLLHRSQNDWKAAIELTEALKIFDPADPVKYDFALFGSGVMKGDVFRAE